MIKKFKQEFLREVLRFNEDEISKTMEAQRKFPELLGETNDKDFIIDGEKLCEQMGVKDNFNTWLLGDTRHDKNGKLKSQGKLIKYRCVENRDFVVDWDSPNGAFSKQEIENMSPQKRSSYGINNSIKLTLNCAKKIAMRQNNEAGDLVCDYFLLMESAVKGVSEHNLVREPEKENYNKMKQAILNEYYKNHDNVTKTDESCVMIQECNMINMHLLGYTASDVRRKLGYLDKQTREHLEIQQNKAINYIQLIITGLVQGGMTYNDRSNLVKNICTTQYPHLKMA